MSEDANIKLCKRGYCSAKAKYKVYPSAYANGYAVKVCKGLMPDVTGKKKNDYTGKKKPSKSDLARWYAEDWVDVCTKNSRGKYKTCGRNMANLKNKKDYPYCRPLNKMPGTRVVTADQLSESKRKKMCAKKKSIKPGVKGKPTRVYLKDIKVKNPKSGRYVKGDGQIGRGLLYGGNSNIIYMSGGGSGSGGNGSGGSGIRDNNANGMILEELYADKEGYYVYGNDGNKIRAIKNL